MKKYIHILISVPVLFSLSCSRKEFWPAEKSPAFIAGLVTSDLLSRQGFMMYNTPDVKSVHYAEVCTAFGAARLAAFLNRDQVIEQLSARYMKVIDDSIINTANHVDTNVYGILPLELFLHTGDSVFYRQGMELADGQWENPLPDGLTSQTRFWIDDIWMIGSLQVQAYRITGDKKYLDRAALEIAAYLDQLQQPNGLFYHGKEAPFFWGRGNGWVAAGLAELLSELPSDHKLYADIEQGYLKMMKALLEYQCEDGMWRQLIDNEQAWKESSSTGMFGYAISVGVNMGILKDRKFREAREKAWLALTGHISDTGRIGDVCVGTGQSLDVNYYLERPKTEGDSHGQAPVLWFAWSLLQ